MNKKTLAQYLDLANHHQGATPEEIRDLCRKVGEFGFNAAFVNPCYVRLAKETLAPGGRVGTVVSFPLGQDTKDIKILSAIKAVRDGGDELDVMMNVGLFKGGKHDEILEEMRAVVASVRELKKITVVKFIIETGALTSEEIKKASELVLLSGADFVKTCSGFGPRGATLEDVDLIKSVVGKKIKIKVAGGIDTYEEAIAFIEKGVDRIGTSQAVKIIEEMKVIEKGNKNLP